MTTGAETDPETPQGRVGRQIASIVDTTVRDLDAIPEARAGEPTAPGKWSRKQVLGHLIDSGANNHQRFVRAQLAPSLTFPGYEQDGWVGRQGYQERPWAELVALWAALNRHLAHVVARIDPAALDTPCAIGSGAPVSLRFVAEDYVRHLRHHLEQILSPETATGKTHAPFAEKPQ